MNIDPIWVVCGLLYVALFFLGFLLLDVQAPGTRNVARIGVLLSAALALSLAESFLPDFLLPGLRLGLANIAVLLVLFVYGFRDALWVAIGKAVLASLLRGSIFSMGGWMALMGTVCSFFVMAGLHALWKKCSPIGVSVLGAIFHVLGQFLIAWLYLGVGIFGYLPWLLLSALVTGALVGVVAMLLLRNKALLRYLRRENF